MNKDVCNTLQVREYGRKIGSVLRTTNDRHALLQKVTRTKDVLPGVPISDFKAVLGKTAVDSQFLAAVSTAKLTKPQVNCRRLYTSVISLKAVLVVVIFALVLRIINDPRRQ